MHHSGRMSLIVKNVIVEMEETNIHCFVAALIKMRLEITTTTNGQQERKKPDCAQQSTGFFC